MLQSPLGRYRDISSVERLYQWGSQCRMEGSTRSVGGTPRLKSLHNNILCTISLIGGHFGCSKMAFSLLNQIVYIFCEQISFLAYSSFNNWVLCQLHVTIQKTKLGSERNDISLWMKGKERWVPYPKDCWYPWGFIPYMDSSVLVGTWVYKDMSVVIRYLWSWLATVLDVSFHH